MDLGLTNKVVLVSGASKGIGFATALAFAQEGARVAIGSRDKDSITAAAAEIHKKTGAEVFAMPLDVTQPQSILDFVAALGKKWGEIHVCVTNTAGPPSKLFLELNDEQWKAAFELTLMSAVRLSRAVYPFMEKQKWGRIIHLCSSSVKNQIPNLLLSNSLRSAVVALGKTQAEEWASAGILVNSVLTGWTATERTQEIMRVRAEKQNVSVEEAIQARTASIPLRRMGKPEEIANAILFLASERASFITGTNLLVDGGESRFPF